MSSSPIIVCFDGVCNVCSRWVTFLVPRDLNGRFKFAALQSQTGEAILKKYGLSTTDFDSMLVVEGERVYFRSDAILRVLKGLPWYWSWQGYLGMLVPRFMRDAFYRWFARNRYRWFGKKEQCMIPTPDIKARFLP